MSLGREAEFTRLEARLMEKMGLDNVAELVRYAIAHKLVGDADLPR